MWKRVERKILGVSLDEDETEKGTGSKCERGDEDETQYGELRIASSIHAGDRRRVA